MCVCLRERERERERIYSDLHINFTLKKKALSTLLLMKS